MAGARTGHQYPPWGALDADTAEGRREVYSGALGWTGCWCVAVAQLPGARVRITGGAGRDDSGLLVLAPGESGQQPWRRVYSWNGESFGVAHLTVRQPFPTVA